MSSRFGRGWLLLASLGCACSETTLPLTQIVVQVDSDLSVPSELDALRIDVTGVVNMSHASADLTQDRLPRGLGLVHSSGPLGPITVMVRGSLKGEPVVQRVASVWFEKDKTLLLQMPLEHSCVDTPVCSGETTCAAGECVPIAVGLLPAWKGETKPFVAGSKAGTAGGAGAAGASGVAAVAGSGAGKGGTGAGSGGRAGTAAGSGGAAGKAGAAGGGVSTNLPPSCAISKPMAGDTYVYGDTVTFSGSCHDPESGTLETGLRWESDLDSLISVLARTSRTTLRVGQHIISLCGTDPNDATLKGCASVVINVVALPVVAASLDSLTQGASNAPPFAPNTNIVASGSATGIDPVTLSWSDSLLGALGTEATVTLASPPVGKHTLVLTATDGRGHSASDSRTFLVLEPEKAQLVAPYALVNQTLSSDGSARADVLSSASISVYAAVSPGKLYHFDPTEDPSAVIPMLVQTTAPSLIRDVFLPGASGLAYVALNTGYEACTYAPGTGIDVTMCTSYQGGMLPSNEIGSLARVSAGNALDYLLVGSSKGLLVAASAAGSQDGSKFLNDIAITAFANDDQSIWIASADGLYMYDLKANAPINAAPRRQTIDANGPGNVLNDVALGTDGMVWVGSASGLGQLVPSTSTWTTWRAATVAGGSTSLASNDVRAVALARGVSIAGVARDIVWVATAAGVSRFDPSIPSFTTLTVDDGLPSSSVRAVVVLKNGDKVFGTDSGLAQYKGP